MVVHQSTIETPLGAIQDESTPRLDRQVHPPLGPPLFARLEREIPKLQPSAPQRVKTCAFKRISTHSGQLAHPLHPVFCLLEPHLRLVILRRKVFDGYPLPVDSQRYEFLSMMIIALTSSQLPQSPSRAPSSPCSARLSIARARVSDNKPPLWRSSPRSISSATLHVDLLSTMTARPADSPRLPPRPLAQGPAGEQACSRLFPCDSSSESNLVWPCRVAGRQLQAHPTTISPTHPSHPQGR